MVEEDNILLPVISGFEFGELGLFFLLVDKTWMNINSHFFSKSLIIEIDMFFWVNKCFKFILEVVKKMIHFIKYFLRVLNILPIRSGLKYWYDL